MNEHDRLGAAGSRSVPFRKEGLHHHSRTSQRGWAPSEVAFLLSLPLALAAVIYSGMLSYKEGHRLEVAKANATELVKWAEGAGAQHEKGEASLPAACSAVPAVAAAASDASHAASEPAQAAAATESAASATGQDPHATHAAASTPAEAASVASAASAAHAHEVQPAVAAASAPPSTWAKCKQALLAHGGPLADAKNPFNPKESVMGTKCERDKPLTRGQLVVEKGTPPPPGISGSVSYASIEDSEPIVKGLMLKIIVCDKGSYPIKVSEVKL